MNKVRELIQSGARGRRHFITVLAHEPRDVPASGGVIQDLAPHDFSILLYWLDSRVASVSASAQSVFQDGIHETAFLTLTFANHATANIQISWLAPRKVRQMVVVGSRRMVHFDDTAADDVVRVYDRGMEFESPSSFGEYKLTYRAGDVPIPRVEPQEPLRLELEDFAHAIRTGEEPPLEPRLGP